MIDVVCSALELFIIKRKIKGPSWLSISKFSSCAASQRVRHFRSLLVLFRTAMSYCNTPSGPKQLFCRTVFGFSNPELQTSKLVIIEVSIPFDKMLFNKLN